MKKNCLQFYLKEICKHKTICILFFFPLAVICLYYMDILKIHSYQNRNTIEICSTILLTLAFSCFSGIIVYIFTVLIPHIKIYRVVLLEITEALRYFKDELIEFANDVGFTESNCKNHDINTVLEHLINSGCIEKKESGGLFSIDKESSIYIKEKVNLFEGYITKIKPHYTYLSYDQIEELVEIGNSYFFNQVKHHFSTDNTTYYNEEDLKKLIDDYISIYNKVEKLYNNLKVKDEK